MEKVALSNTITKAVNVRYGSAAQVVSREIKRSDISAVAYLLHARFPKRSMTDFLDALALLGSRQPASGMPQYGYLLEAHSRPVGALLTIMSPASDHPHVGHRCNVACWSVESAFAPYAPLLLLRVKRVDIAQIINTSPRDSTLTTIESQGFRRFINGEFLAFAGMFRRNCGSSAYRAGTGADFVNRLPAEEHKILTEHASFGCVTLVCASNACAYPFVFRVQRPRSFLPPFAKLIYCRDIGHFVECAPVIERFLAKQGIFCVRIAANSALKGLHGTYLENRNPMYYLGGEAPRLGDLTYTETALFGF